MRGMLFVLWLFEVGCQGLGWIGSPVDVHKLNSICYGLIFLRPNTMVVARSYTFFGVLLQTWQDLDHFPSGS